MVIKSLSDTNKVSLDIKDLCLQFYFILYIFWINWMIQNVAKIKINMKKSSKLLIIPIPLPPVISKIYNVKT